MTQPMRGSEQRRTNSRFILLNLASRSSFASPLNRPRFGRFGAAVCAGAQGKGAFHMFSRLALTRMAVNSSMFHSSAIREANRAQNKGISTGYLFVF
jgi:hypothetical protein